MSVECQWMKNRFFFFFHSYTHPMNFQKNPKLIYDILIFAIRIKFEAHERKGETFGAESTQIYTQTKRINVQYEIMLCHFI